MKAEAQSLAEKEALEWAIVFFRDLGDELTPAGSRAEAYNAEYLIEMYDEWRKRFQTKESLDPAAYRKSDLGFEAHIIRLGRVSETPEGDSAIFEVCALAAELIERG